MEELFYINGAITAKTRTEFKVFLKPFLNSKDRKKKIRIRLRSWGGNSGEGKFIEGFIYYMKKYESCSFTMEAEIAASAAFRIFIRGDERIIHSKSIIQPHLPVPNKAHVTPERTASEQQADLKFITSTIPGLAKEDILNYNNSPFPIKMMEEKRVVTSIVNRF